MTKLLVLITGTGRSGTSTMSGTLHYLGLYVPGPFLGANKSNPKGFFESKWAKKFHERIVERAGIHNFDSRPAALLRAQQAVTPQTRARLQTFVAERAAEADQVVVKDPRSVWVQKMWRDAAEQAGMEIRYISMLRHPAEVVGSRSTYYAGDDASPEHRRRYEVFNVARWVNSSLISERETRGFPRAFVRYDDLLEDWRAVAERLRDDLGLRYDTDLTPGSRHPVDDFVDPTLRRHTVTWDELDIPAPLQEVAEEVWAAQLVLAGAGGSDPEAEKRLDESAQRYSAVLRDAQAISHDALLEARSTGFREGEARAHEALKPAGSGLDQPQLGDASGRELLKALGLRTARRLRRR